jgi:hypothetical protein
MSKIDRFLAKPEKVTLAGEEIEIYPLAVKDVALLLRARDPITAPDAIRDILLKTLKAAFPDATDEQVERFGLQYLNEIIETIGKVNNLDLKIKKV